MTELEKIAEQFAKDIMDGKLDKVVKALSDSNAAFAAIAFLGADIDRRLDNTASLIFRRAIHIQATAENK